MYVFRCIDARYDEKECMLVLLVFCEDFGEQRILHLSKSNFHYKIPGVEVPDIEMHRTADSFRGKRFNMEIKNDPNIKMLKSEEQEKDITDYREYVVSQMEKISEGLSNVDKNIVKRLADVVERDRERKEKHPPNTQDVLDELKIRDRMKGKI